MLGARIPSQLKDEVDREDRPNQDVVEAALRRYLGTDDRGRLEMRLEHAREKRRIQVEKRDYHQQKIDELDEEIAAVESRLADLESDARTYTEELDAILDEMVETGMHVDHGHGAITDLVDEPKRSADEVHADLKERAQERDLELHDRRFEERGRSP